MQRRRWDDLVMEPEVHEALRCTIHWGSHGCGRTRGHQGNHACIGDVGCGGEVDQGGRDDGGFQWDLWGQEVDERDPAYWDPPA